MTSEAKEVFRGHVDECLAHLAVRLSAISMPGSKGSTQVRQPIADFTNVGVHTVTRWFNHRSVPTGESYLKLLCFLEVNGYRVLELERMKSVYRNFVELIGYGVLSIDEAMPLLGFAPSQTKAVYEILKEKRGISERRVQKMYLIWKAKRHLLAQQKENAKSKYVLKLDPIRSIDIHREGGHKLATPAKDPAPNVFSGSMEECLAHLVKILYTKYLKGSRAAVKARMPIAEFCGVQNNALVRWFDLHGMPAGEVAIKLMCFLDLNGYKVDELEKMSAVIRNLAELIGYSVMSAEDVSVLVSYSHSSSLFQALWGKVGISEAREERMRSVCEERGENLEQNKQAARINFRLKFLPEPGRVLTSAHKQPDKKAVDGNQSHHQKTVFHRMEELVELLDNLAMSSISDELPTHAEAILRLSSHLNNLSARVVNQIPEPK